MAYGQSIKFTATFPPPPANTPLPAIITVTTDIAVAIADAANFWQLQASFDAETICGPNLTTGNLSAVNNSFSQIVGQLGRIDDTFKPLTDAATKAEVSITAYTALLQARNQMLAQQVATQLKTNNFAIRISDEDPTMPSLFVQLKESMIDGQIHWQVSKVTSGAVGIVNSSISEMGKTIAATDTYKTVKDWFDSAVTYVTSFLPESLRSTSAKKAAQTGTQSS